MFKIEVYDASFKNVFEDNVQIEVIKTGFRFLEGPVWDHEKEKLTFSDIIGNGLYQLKGKEVTLYRPNSYLANGNTLNRKGELLTCEHGTSRVSLTDKDGKYKVLTSKYREKELNSPNDIICSTNGRIYFTDPMPGRCERVGIPRKQELDFQGIYMYDTENDKLTLLDDTFELPNGVCLDEKEKKLYVNDSRRHHIKMFDVNRDGTLSNKKLFANLKEDGEGVADGLKFNTANMLFCSAPGGIQVFNLEGQLIGRIWTPEVTANFTWGGNDMKDMYLAATTTLYRLRSNISGYKLY